MISIVLKVKRQSDLSFYIVANRSNMDSKVSESSITEIIIRCVNFAAVKHRNQRRKDYAQTPYINHPIGKLFHRRITL